uniref:Ecdysone receptor n=1 Tax=Panagrolaimus sp. JU765 TaxID=591449 RepID=A0AC34Q309_9BILA
MEEEKPCLVCGDPKATYHYGSHCCSGCKGFFRRSIRSKRKYTCQNAGNCDVTVVVHGDRGKNIKSKQDLDDSESSNLLKTDSVANDDLPSNPCSSVVKMEKNEVMESRYKKWSQLALNLKLDSNSNTCPLSTMRIIPIFDRADAYSVSQYFVAVEKLCDNFVDSHASHMFSLESEYHCTASISAETAYSNPRNVSYRTPIDWKGRYHIDSKKLKPMWCRIFTHYVDWLSHVPELTALSMTDQTKLMIDRCGPCVNIMCGYRAIVTNTKGIVLSGGSYYPRDETELKRMDKKVSLKQANWVYDEFISPARHMRLTENEYAILRVLVYLMPADGMSEDGKRVVREAANFYRNVLCTQIRQSYPDLSFQQVMDRMSRIMVFLSVFENAKAMANAGFSMMVLFNCPEMNEDLIYEVHVRGHGVA